MPSENRPLKWKKRGDGYLPPLPNSGSDHTTATTKLLDLHYSNLRIAERWNYERVERLCSVLKITPYELASLVCMPHAYLDKLRDTDRLPAISEGGGRAIGLLLTMIEARILKKLCPDVIENPIPHLGNKIRQGERETRLTADSHG